MRKKLYTKHVGVLLSEEVYDKIIEITDTIEISVSRYIREVVEEKINKSERKGFQNE